MLGSKRQERDCRSSSASGLERRAQSPFGLQRRASSPFGFQRRSSSPFGLPRLRSGSSFSGNGMQRSSLASLSSNTSNVEGDAHRFDFGVSARLYRCACCQTQVMNRGCKACHTRLCKRCFHDHGCIAATVEAECEADDTDCKPEENTELKTDDTTWEQEEEQISFHSECISALGWFREVIVPLSVSVLSHIHTPPLFLSSVFCGGACIAFAVIRSAPLYLILWICACSTTSTLLHYGQKYRSFLARLDGKCFQSSGAGFVFLALRVPDRPLWERAGILGLTVYAAAVFFAFLREAWYEPGSCTFRPYNHAKLILHLTVHFAGMGVTLLMLCAVTDQPAEM